MAGILQQAHQLGKQYAQALIKHQSRSAIGDAVGRFFQRAKEIVGGIVGRIRGVAKESDDPQADVESLADTLPDLVAITEIHTEVEQAVQEEFEQAGLTQVAWVCEPDACELCLGNQEAGPVLIADAFPSGHTEPPAHPRCRCNLVPAGDMPLSPEDALADRYPCTEFDFTGIDPEIIPKIVKQIETLYEDYPEVAASIGYIGTGEGVPFDPGFEAKGYVALSTMDYPGDGKQAIFLNPDFFESALAMQDMIALTEPGWFAADGSAESLITHEFGHSIYYYLREQRDMSILGFIDDMSGEGSIAAMLGEWFDRNDRFGASVSGYAKEGGYKEAWAEAFSTFYYGTSGSYADQMKTMLDEIFNNKWERIDPSETTSVQRKQWSAFVNKYIAMD